MTDSYQSNDSMECFYRLGKDNLVYPVPLQLTKISAMIALYHININIPDIIVDISNQKTSVANKVLPSCQAVILI